MLERQNKEERRQKKTLGIGGSRSAHKTPVPRSCVARPAIQAESEQEKQKPTDSDNVSDINPKNFNQKQQIYIAIATKQAIKPIIGTQQRTPKK